MDKEEEGIYEVYKQMKEAANGLTYTEQSIILLSPKVYEQLSTRYDLASIAKPLEMAALINYKDNDRYTEPKLTMILDIPAFHPFKKHGNAAEVILSRVTGYLNKGMEKQAVNYLIKQIAYTYKEAKLKVNKVKQQMIKNKQLKNYNHEHSKTIR